MTDIHLARNGQVTSRNFTRLGYERLIRGVYGRPPASTGDQWEQQRTQFLTKVQAVMAAYHDTGVVTFGVTALQVMGVALPQRLQDWDSCHILVPRDGPRPQRQDVTTHRSIHPPTVWKSWSGVPVSHPVDHWLQLRGASIDDLVEVGDGFLRRKNPLLSVDDMRARLEQAAGWAGVKKATSAMRLVRPGTDSLYETRTRLMLVHAGLPEPSVNLEVWCADVGRLFHVDLGYEKEKVAVEYDGAVHVGDRTQMSIDAERRRILQDHGWLIITVTAEQFRTPQSIIHSVESALVLRGTGLKTR